MQFIVSGIQQDGTQLHIALALYIANDFNFAAAKANADALQAQLQTERDEFNANAAQIALLQEENRLLNEEIAATQAEVIAAQNALKPDAAFGVSYALVEFADILSNEKLTSAEKIQAMIAAKRAEIEAQAKAKAALLILQKEAESVVVGAPIDLNGKE